MQMSFYEKKKKKKMEGSMDGFKMHPFEMEMAFHSGKILWRFQ
jgi:hypothetical protein